MDKFWIDLFDKYALKAQRNGWSLAAGKVYASAFVLLFFLGADLERLSRHFNKGEILVAGFFICLFFFLLRSRYKTFLQEKDYFENHRLTVRLNAKALLCREDQAYRRGRAFFAFLVWSSCFIDFVLTIFNRHELYWSDLLSTLGMVTAYSQAYIDTCFYIGPGEFGKDYKAVQNRIMIPLPNQ